MTLEILKQLHPELTTVVKAILPPNPKHILYGEDISLLDLLPEALQNDPGIDSDDADMIMRVLDWVNHPTIVLYISSSEWEMVKKNIISKNKFLESTFQKSKLRRSSMHNIHTYFQVYPSLICLNERIYDQWNEELRKVVPDEKLAAKLREEDPDVEFVGTPSLYDTYDSEAKVSYSDKVGGILHAALVVYVETYHPSLKKQ